MNNVALFKKIILCARNYDYKFDKVYVIDVNSLIKI